MTIIDIINKKRKRKELTKKEIEFVINGYLNQSVKDCQISSLLMAIVLNGMTDMEVINLTDIMIKSGDILDFSKIDDLIVGNHSIGGIEDKVTLIMEPLLASLDIKISKICSDCIGYTGGIIDKFKSMECFKTKTNEKEIIKQINDINIALVQQTDNLVPADKKIYELRYRTGTIESIPLIASSVMSKEIASGSDIIMIEIKVGNGSLIKNIKDARELARLIVKIGKVYRKTTICLITNMDEPLGYAIGNALEVEEAIEALKGNGSSDLLEVVMTFCSIIIGAAKKIHNNDAKNLLFKQLNNGEAYKKFEQLVNSQGGNIENLKVSDKVFSIKSDKSGYINKIDTLHLGEIARKIGACRNNLEDKIDYCVGLVLNKKVGDFVEKDEEIVKVFLKDKDISIGEILECFKIEDELNVNKKLILDIIK